MGEQEKGRNKSEKVRVAATRIGVQALNRAKKPMARAILRKLSPEIKARIARNQDTIETVSSMKLASELDKACEQLPRVMPILIEIRDAAGVERVTSLGDIKT